MNKCNFQLKTCLSWIKLENNYEMLESIPLSRALKTFFTQWISLNMMISKISLTLVKKIIVLVKSILLNYGSLYISEHTQHISTFFLGANFVCMFTFTLFFTFFLITRRRIWILERFQRLYTFMSQKSHTHTQKKRVIQNVYLWICVSVCAINSWPNVFINHELNHAI